jgi:hypothetical protein
MSNTQLEPPDPVDEVELVSVAEKMSEEVEIDSIWDDDKIVKVSSSQKMSRSDTSTI